MVKTEPKIETAEEWEERSKHLKESTTAVEELEAKRIARIKTDPAKKMGMEEAKEPTGIGTFVHDKATAERMLAGAERHLHGLPKGQQELRVHGIHLTVNQLRGAVRHARRQQHEPIREFRGAGPVGKSAERAAGKKRAEEFNAKFGVKQDG